jgi:hypothetical protein
MSPSQEGRHLKLSFLSPTQIMYNNFDKQIEKSKDTNQTVLIHHRIRETELVKADFCKVFFTKSNALLISHCTKIYFGTLT